MATITTSPTTPLPPLPPLPRCLATLPTEIAELVLENLSLSSLAACAAVNKAWNTLCGPFLLRTFPWRTVDINTPQKLGQFMTAESRRAFYKNAAHIHSLCLWYSYVYKIFSPLDHAYTPQCTNLRSLHIDMYQDPIFSPTGGRWKYRNRRRSRPLDPVSENAVAALIRRNPGLEKLTVTKYMSPQTLVPLLARDLPNLQVLVLDEVYCVYNHCIIKVLLEHLPESIRSITMSVGQGKPARCAAAAGALRKQLGWKKNKTPPRQHHALESLTLDRWYICPDYSSLLLPFLNSCSSKLRTIRMSGWFRDRDIREVVLDRLGYTLTEITDRDVPGFDSSRDPEVAEYICLSDQWRTINFDHCSTVGPQTVRAISERCEHIQYLNIGRCRNISSTVLNVILAKAPCLKTFVALHRQGPAHSDDPFLSAQDLITLDWGSLALEEFHCKIIVPASDRHWDDEILQEKVRFPTHGAVVASHRMQRLVYRKLAEQKSLKSLFLGQYPTASMSQAERWYQSRCLEMTLESGLDELADFQKLEQLNLRSMGLRIGVPELEWMVAHWPNLKFAEGLFDTLHQNPPPGVCEWVRDNRIDWLSFNEKAWLRTRLQ